MNVSLNVHADPEIAREVRELALEGYTAPERIQFESKERFLWLRRAGSRLWLDTGEAEAAEKVWSAELEALTTNNTLVNQVVQTGVMDGLVTYAARKLREKRPDISEQDLVVELAFLVNAKVALGLVQKFGAHVSVELHPDLGSDIEGILTFVRRYYAINPDYFYVKVPLTPDGFIAVRKLSLGGIPINFTLGFSARQNYFTAQFARPRFVNVFLGRLNQVAEENGVGRPENIGEKAALASDEKIKDIRASQADIQTQQIAASMRNGRQVATLAGMDVLTIPPKAASEYLEMEITKEEIDQQNWRDLQVDVDEEYKPKFAKLWEIDGHFVNFVEDIMRLGDTITSGKDLIRRSQILGVDLFYDWSEDDRRRLREKGKIPDLKAWPNVPLDELMSMSALEAFAKDQQALDDRIKGLIAES